MKDDDKKDAILPRKEEKKEIKETKLDDERKIKVNEFIAITQGLNHYDKAMLNLSTDLRTEKEWAKHLESLKGKKE